MAERRTVLHVGCGDAPLPAAEFPRDQWQEIRLDIDPNMPADYHCSITTMHPVGSATVDAIYCSHNLEHLFSHEVPAALAEFHRVLKPGGFARIRVPDLFQVAQCIVQDRLEDAAYMAPCGPIAALDMLYGHRESVAKGKTPMAHRTGFSAKTLVAKLAQAGFTGNVERLPWELVATAIKGR
jgi:SAM-dependent methyltransferase